MRIDSKQHDAQSNLFTNNFLKFKIEPKSLYLTDNLKILPILRYTETTSPKIKEFLAKINFRWHHYTFQQRHHFDLVILWSIFKKSLVQNLNPL